MTTVRGFLQMLSVKREMAAYRDYFTIMVDELDRANAIITEYLSAAKIENQLVQTENLNQIIEKLAPLLQANALKDNIELKLELGECADFILNEKQIKQLIINLARNGIEAMTEGGTLTIRTLQQGDKVLLSIEDTGKGIPVDILAKIGTPFLTTKSNGTGLGLSVCHSIAAKHQAVLQVESTGPQGTCMTVEFTLTGHPG
jgi:signal transduction histidine kinase